MSTDIRIRPARPDDIPAMIILLRDLFSLEADFSPDREKQERGLRALLEAPADRSCALVADAGGRVVGMATVQALISTAEGGPVGLVEDVIVLRRHRGKGIGSRLIGGIIEWCRSRGLTRLQLLADRSNRVARTFYGRAGFRSTGLICLRKHVCSRAPAE